MIDYCCRCRVRPLLTDSQPLPVICHPPPPPPQFLAYMDEVRTNHSAIYDASVAQTSDPYDPRWRNWDFFGSMYKHCLPIILLPVL